MAGGVARFASSSASIKRGIPLRSDPAKLPTTLTDGFRSLHMLHPMLARHASVDAEYMYERNGMGGGGGERWYARGLDSDSSEYGESARSGGLRSMAGSCGMERLNWNLSLSLAAFPGQCEDGGDGIGGTHTSVVRVLRILVILVTPEGVAVGGRSTLVLFSAPQPSSTKHTG